MKENKKVEVKKTEADEKKGKKVEVNEMSETLWKIEKSSKNLTDWNNLTKKERGDIITFLLDDLEYIHSNDFLTEVTKNDCYVSIHSYDESGKDDLIELSIMVSIRYGKLLDLLKKGIEEVVDEINNGKGGGDTDE